MIFQWESQHRPSSITGLAIELSRAGKIETILMISVGDVDGLTG
jgi:hypothetical protein